jgi:four helix bundle protein
MSNNQNQNKNKYDLSERTAKFGEAVIDFVKTIKESNISRPIISQLIRSATSIGANYMEADCAESKKDFRHKIGICKKESKETLHWLRMLARAEVGSQEVCRNLYRECHQLVLIFSAIVKKE